MAFQEIVNADRNLEPPAVEDWTEQPCGECRKPVYDQDEYLTYGGICRRCAHKIEKMEKKIKVKKGAE